MRSCSARCSFRTPAYLGVGADADLVALNPDTATYLAPTSPSVGMRHLLVAGTPVISDGELVTDAYPGQPLRSTCR